MKSIKINFVFNTLLNISTIVFPLITAPYIARVLSPDDVGLFNFANTYSIYFSMVAALGIPVYGIREIAKFRSSKTEVSIVLSELFSLSLFTTIIASVLYFSSLFVIPQLKQDFWVFAIIGFVLYLSPLNINWFFSGFEDFAFITYRSLIVKTLSVISIFFFVKTRNDLLAYVWITVFASVANNVWNILALYQQDYSIKISFHGIRKHLHPCLILFSSGIATTLYTVLDTMMLGFMTNYAEVAYYNYATHISKALIVVITSITAVSLPRVSYYFGESNFQEINSLLNKAFSVVLFLAIPITLSLLLISPTLVPLFLGSQYYGAIIPLQILSFLVIAIGINNLIGTLGLVGIGYDKLLLYSVLYGAGANVVLNSFLIPLYGAIGASVSSVIAESIVAAATFIFMIKKTPLSINMTKSVLITCLTTFLLLPLFLLIKNYFDGWPFVLLYTISGTLLYIVIQTLLKNPVIDPFFSMVKQKLNFKI